MSAARIKLDVACPAIEVRRGEWVTVWLRTDDGSGFDRIQCELRVDPDGTPRVFLPARNVHIVDMFDRWTGMHAPPSGEPGEEKGRTP